MNRTPDVLDRLAPLFELPGHGFEDLLQRRKKREQARKVGAIGLVTAILATFVAVGLGSLGSRRGQPADPPDASFQRIQGWIVYRDSGDLVAVDPADPTNRISLGRSGGLDPIGWSQNGNRLLGRRGGDLYVLEPDGTEVRLTHDSGLEFGPFERWGSISPDGTRVVYANPFDRGLYTVDAAGSKPELILTDVREPFAESPAWSPDGSRIALLDFLEESSHTYGLTVVNPDGSGRVVKVKDLGVGDDAHGLVWSPDGSRLAFFAYTDASTGGRYVAGPGRIYVVDTQTWEVQQLTGSGDSRWPAWSPDSTRIAFVRNGGLFTMRSDGEDVQKVPGVEPAPDASIAWNPQSKG